MGWISGDIDKYDTEEQVMNEWDSIYDELPTRTADGNSLRFLGTCATEKEGREKLAAAERNLYGMAYVKISSAKKSAKQRDAENLLAKEKAKLRQFLDSSSIFKSHHGKTVGCTKCGASFPVKYFRRRLQSGMFEGEYEWEGYYDDYIYPQSLYSGDAEYINKCPICGTEMRPKSTLERIDGYEANIRKYSNRIQELEKASADKAFYLGVIHAYCG